MPIHMALTEEQFLPNRLEVTTSQVLLTVGTPAAARLQASGGSNAATWQALDPLPPGLLLSTAGAITGTPTASGDWPPVRVVLTDPGPPVRNTYGMVTINVQ